MKTCKGFHHIVPALRRRFTRDRDWVSHLLLISIGRSSAFARDDTETPRALNKHSFTLRLLKPILLYAPLLSRASPPPYSLSAQTCTRHSPGDTFCWDCRPTDPPFSPSFSSAYLVPPGVKRQEVFSPSGNTSENYSILLRVCMCVVCMD